MISTQRALIFRSVNSKAETMRSGLSTNRIGKPNHLVLRQQTSSARSRLKIRLNGSKLFTLLGDLWAFVVDCCSALSRFMVYFNCKIFPKISVMNNLEAPCANNVSAASNSTLFPFSFSYGRMI